MLLFSAFSIVLSLLFSASMLSWSSGEFESRRLLASDLDLHDFDSALFSLELRDDNEDKDDVETVSRVDNADDLKLDIELNELSELLDVDESTPGLAVDELVVEEEEAVGDDDDDDDEELT